MFEQYRSIVEEVERLGKILNGLEIPVKKST